MKSLHDRLLTQYEKKKEWNDDDEPMIRAYESYKSSWDNMKQRLYTRAYEIVLNGGYFITLTYKDPPKEKEVLKHMKLWSREMCELFISNIDYGDDNGRIHIHSLCLPKKEIHKSWKYGIINFIKVKQDKRSARNTALYVSKMVNHAVKGTAKHLIRSKKIKKGEN